MCLVQRARSFVCAWYSAKVFCTRHANSIKNKTELKRYAGPLLRGRCALLAVLRTGLAICHGVRF
jgi:hypothetical protein